MKKWLCLVLIICMASFVNASIGLDVWVPNSVGDNITFLNASNSYAPTDYTSGDSPMGVAVDGNHNVWITISGDDKLSVLNASEGYAQTDFYSGDYPAGVSIDGYNNVWVANSEDDKVSVFNASDGYSQTNYSTGLYPYGVAVDGYNNIWFTLVTSRIVSVLNASDGYAHTSYGVGNYPAGVSIDGYNNVWVTIAFADLVTLLNASDGYSKTDYAVGDTPKGVSIDGYNNVWVVDSRDDRISVLNASDGYAHTSYGVGNYPQGVSIDGYNNVWVANADDDKVSVLYANAGYSRTDHIVGDRPFSIGDMTGVQWQRIFNSSFVFLKQNQTPFFNETSADYSTEQSHNSTFYIDLNATDINFDVIQYFINDTSNFIVDINTGILTGNPSVSDTSNKQYTVYAGDGNTNASLEMGINITNSAPTLTSVTINNTSPAVTDPLNCTFDSETDIDNDAIFHQFEWYNDSILTSYTDFNLSESITSEGDTWYCRIRANDTLDQSGWYSSGTVFISGGGGPSTPNIISKNQSTLETDMANNVTYPTNTNQLLNLTVFFSDSNADDNHSVFWCYTNNFNGACVDGQWGNSSSFLDRVYDNLTLNVSDNSLSSYEYFAFVKDNSSLWSAGSAGTFHVNHRPITSISEGNVYSNITQANVTFASTDSDSDSVTYALYNNSVNNSWGFYETVTSTFSWNSSTERVWYYFARGIDEHNYNSTEEIVYTLTFDFTRPFITITFPTNRSTFSEFSFTSQYTITDNYAFGSCTYDLYYRSTDIFIGTTAFNCDASSTTVTVPSQGLDYKIKYKATDAAGNMNETDFIFITSTIPTTPPPVAGGGASSGDDDTPAINETALRQTILEGICGNNICEEGEQIFSCPADCAPVFGDVSIGDLTWHCWDSDASTRCIWQEAGFTSGMFLIIFLGLGYVFYRNQYKGKRTGSNIRRYTGRVKRWLR